MRVYYDGKEYNMRKIIVERCRCGKSATCIRPPDVEHLMHNEVPMFTVRCSNPLCERGGTFQDVDAIEAMRKWNSAQTATSKQHFGLEFARHA